MYSIKGAGVAITARARCALLLTLVQRTRREPTGTGAAYTADAGAMYNLASAVEMYSTTSAGVAITAGAGVMYSTCGAGAVYTASAGTMCSYT